MTPCQNFSSEKVPQIVGFILLKQNCRLFVFSIETEVMTIDHSTEFEEKWKTNCPMIIFSHAGALGNAVSEFMNGAQLALVWVFQLTIEIVDQFQSSENALHIQTIDLIILN